MPEHAADSNDKEPDIAAPLPAHMEADNVPTMRPCSRRRKDNCQLATTAASAHGHAAGVPVAIVPTNTA